MARVKEGRSAFKILTGTVYLQKKRLLGRPRRRWEDNIRKYLQEIGIKARDCVDSAQYWDYWRVIVNAALNIRVPYAMKFPLYCFDGVIIAAQCTATFLRSIVLPRI